MSLKSFLSFVVSLPLRIIHPLVFSLLNSKVFLIFSRYFMRIFNPPFDVPVVVRGVKMYANSLDRILALLFWKYSLVESYEIDLMQSLVKPDMSVVNCGANVGFHTMQLAKMVGEQGEVFAFEPDSNCCRLLKKTLNANGIKNVTVIKKGVSHYSGKTKFYFCEENRGDHKLFDDGTNRSYCEVETTSLDDYFPSGFKVDLIKMDIQGSEKAALDGMLRLISENPGVKILTELCPTLLKQAGSSGREFIDALIGLGFEIEFVDEDRKQLNKIPSEELLSFCKDRYYCSILARPKMEKRQIAVNGK